MAGQLPLTLEDKANYLREHGAPDFLSAVEKATTADHLVLLSVAAFAGEPEVLYVALDYARWSGVEVRLIPQPGEPDPNAEVDRQPALLS